ncbi:MAG: hypothetical protein KKG70_03835 [Proteobacteria bacterium]|nr:hypothetical protein [Pseudomonadota bacterium]
MRKKTVKKKYSRFSIVMTSLLVCFLVGVTPGISAELAPAERCLDCHDDIWEEGMAQSFIHAPFQEQQCQACHVAAPFKRGKRLDNKQERSEIKWIARNSSPAEVHWFKFSVPEDHGTIFIEADGNLGKSVQDKVQLPSLDGLPRYDNDHQAPKISKVRVLEVERGLFVSATIGWETDEIANSTVNYGINKLNIVSPRESTLVTHHRVTLSGIKSSKTYQFQVVSEDLFGNKSTSEVFSLSTAKTFSSADEQSLAPIQDVIKIGMDTELFQSDGEYLAKITANQSVKLGLGSIPNTFRNPTYVEDVNTSEDIKHVLIYNELNLNILICYSCHRKYQESMSHPVDVYPKRGMVIPPEYTTLADGRITCMSCHQRHASNLDNRLIKASNRELCRGCHKDMA